MAKYSIEDTTLTAIADEIRNKTSLTDSIDNEQMIIDIASLPPLTIGAVPAYVQTEAERVADIVKALQSDNTLSFIAMSDVHVGSDTQSRNSALHASQAVNLIKKYASIDFSIVLGDIVTGASSDSLETHIDNHMCVKRTLAMIEPIAVLDGNHDANIYNSASYMSASDLYKYQGRHNIDVVKPTTETERNYFYFDIESKKTRVICLNTADLKDISASTPKDGHHISAVQFQWFVSALDMTNKTDWKVVVLSHHPLHWYGSMPNVLTILNAYIAGISGSITADNTTISYNFSGKNVAKLISTFHGHTHNFINGKVGDNDIIRMGTPNACYSRNNEYGSTAYGEDFRSKYGETTTYSKTANSAKDTAFCVYTIDFENEAIFATCYGAGYDRMLGYGDVTRYTISNVLTGVSTNNSSAFAKAGTSYTATLTVADTYTLKSVVVTMGGVDITSTAVSGNVITIAEVTGDIVITAKATKPATNIIDTIGYTDGYRLSTSNGALKEQAGYVTTGLIDLTQYGGKPATIRTKGVDFRASNYGYSAVVQYSDKNETYNVAHYLEERTHSNHDITFDDKGNMTFVAKETTDYLKFCGYGRGSSLFVTINEEFDDSGNGETGEYTNWLPISTDENGNVLNGCGYETGYRYNSSGGLTANSDCAITGFIPAVQGDTIRLSPDLWVSNQSSYMQITLYDSSKAAVFTGYISMYAITNNGEAEYSTDINGNHVITLTGSSHSAHYQKTAYIRLTVMANACANGIITVNEEIT